MRVNFNVIEFMIMRLALVFMMGVLVGCDSGEKGAMVPEDSGSAVAEVVRIISEDEVAEWGCETIFVGEQEQSEWETREFGEAAVRMQAVKEIKENSNVEERGHGFTIVEEMFGSADAAALRLERLKDHDPAVDEMDYPELVMRAGFQDGQRVLYVMTDSLKVEHEAIPWIVERLKDFVDEEKVE